MACIRSAVDLEKRMATGAALTVMHGMTSHCWIGANETVHWNAFNALRNRGKLIEVSGDWRATKYRLAGTPARDRKDS